MKRKILICLLIIFSTLAFSLQLFAGQDWKTTKITKDERLKVIKTDYLAVVNGAINGGSSDDSDSHEHNWRYEWTMSPTCTSRGYTRYKCTICGKIDDRDYTSPNGHSYHYEYLNSSQHVEVCSGCGVRRYVGSHTFAGGENGTPHYCTVCNQRATSVSDWPNWHYYPGQTTCAFCGRGELHIVSTNVDNYPHRKDYYMIGSGKSWEKTLNTLEVRFNYPPYADKSNSTYNVTAGISTFKHGNWADHAGAWADGQDDAKILDWPAENIKEPLESWKEIRGSWLRLTNVTQYNFEGSVGSTTLKCNVPNGHGEIWRVQIGGAILMDTMDRLYVKGGESTEPTEIPAYVNVVYRDKDGEKIPGAPEDERKKYTIWTDHDQNTKVKVKADHDTLDELGWRYLGYQITETWDAPSKVKPEKTGDEATVEQGLGEQRHTVVFIYEPIKLQIRHVIEVDGEKVLIDTNKNTKDDGIDFYKVSTSTADPNHVCAKLECEGDSDHITKHIVTSLNKIIWPGYILLNYQIKTVDDKVFAGQTYDLYNEDSPNATTVLTAPPVKEKVQKKVEVYTALNGIEEKGHKSDMIIEFEYSTITIKVSHHDMSEAYLQDLGGGSLGPADMILNGVSFYIPSLVTLGTNIWGLTGQQYNVEGYKFVNVKVFNGDKLLGTWGPAESTYFWAFSSAGGSVGADILKEIQKIGNDIRVKFYYEKLQDEVIVKHQDTSGTTLAPDEHHKMVPEGVTVTPKAELLNSGWNNDHYVDDKGSHNPPYSSVYVESSPGKKLVIFVYIRQRPAADSNPGSSNPGSYTPAPDASATVLLKSNARGGEEYNVENSIPTSEDLYGNILTNSFLLKNEVNLKQITVPINVTLIKKYYVTNNTDEGSKPSDAMAQESTQITVDVPIQYFSAEGCVLEILNKATMKNDSIQAEGVAGDGIGKATIMANYARTPEFDYEKGGKIVITNSTSISGIQTGADGQLTGFTYVIPDADHRKPDMSNIAREYNNAGVILDILKNNGAAVKMDRLHVIQEDGGHWIVLSGKELPLGRTYNVVDLKSADIGCTNLLDPTPWTGENTLYRNTDMWVQKTAANSTYATHADIYFKQHQVIGESGIQGSGADGTSYIDVEGNNVTVHTPVVDYATLDLSENNQHNELVNAQNNVIVMGETFKVVIPNSGAHKDATGYGNKAYNWDGLLKADESSFKGHSGKAPSDSFATKKQVKFDFGVVYNNKYYEVNGDWIDLDVSKESFEFMIPTWENEVWDSKTAKIYTRVVAENAIDSSKQNATQENANTNITNYVAVKNIDVKIIGKMYDIQIRATNDPGWADLINGALKVDRFPIGQAGQNPVSGYRYALKMGAKAYFDLKVDGSTGQTSEKVVAIPKYYYVSKTGGKAQEVDLYYHSIGERYINLSTYPVNLTSRMAQNYGTKYFANYTEHLGLANRLAKNVNNYTIDSAQGSTSRIELSQIHRIIAYKTSTDLMKARWNKIISGTLAEENVIKSIGRWYGEIKLPASTIVATKGASLDSIKAGTSVLKNGYLIVAFEKLVTLNGSKEYLSYDKPEGNSQWQKENYQTQINLPNGQFATLPTNDKAMVIYETDIRINNDYEATGTH